MRQPRTLYEMQVAQREHDQKNHPDINNLDLYRKMNHYVHHFGKYAGRLVDAIPDHSLKSGLVATHKDMFLITLSASNTLNVDLDKMMDERFGLPVNGALMHTGYKTYIDGVSLDGFREWTMKSIVRSTGPMHDALEKYDHLETKVVDTRSRWDRNYAKREKDIRAALEDGVAEWAGICLIGMDYLGVDPSRAVENRRKEIARKKIL